METKKQQQIFKVEALTRFLFAPTGRIYDPKDIFEVNSEDDFLYLTEINKLCKKASDDAEISETEQDRRDKLAIEAKEIEDKIKEEVKEVIEEKFTPKEVDTKKSSKKK